MAVDKAYKVMAILERCDKCSKNIENDEEYYTLELSRERRDKNGIVSKLSCVVLVVWCKRCYEEMQQTLKQDLAVIGGR